MVMEFKKDYGNFEERLNLFCKPTWWEIEHNVTIVDKTINELADDIKLVLIKKSDHSETMVIFYNGSKNANPCWFGWIPSKSQMENFVKISNIYFKVDQTNKQNKTFDNGK